MGGNRRRFLGVEMYETMIPFAANLLDSSKYGIMFMCPNANHGNIIMWKLFPSIFWDLFKFLLQTRRDFGLCFYSLRV